MKLIAISFLGLGIFVFFILFLIPDSQVQVLVLDALDWLQNVPTGIGTTVLTIIIIVFLIFGIPVTPLNLASGFLFGFFLGGFVTVLGLQLGAMANFLLGRYLARDWAESVLHRNRKLKIVLNGVSKRNGFFIIFLIRLCPVFPFALCGYMFGVTPVSFLVYSLATLAGLAPGTLAYTYLGTTMKNLQQVWEEGGDSTTEIVFFVVALVSVVLVVTVVTVVTKRIIDKQVARGTELTELGDDDVESLIAPSARPSVHDDTDDEDAVRVRRDGDSDSDDIVEFAPPIATSTIFRKISLAVMRPLTPAPIK